MQKCIFLFHICISCFLSPTSFEVKCWKSICITANMSLKDAQHFTFVLELDFLIPHAATSPGFGPGWWHVIRQANYFTSFIHLLKSQSFEALEGLSSFISWPLMCKTPSCWGRNTCCEWAQVSHSVVLLCATERRFVANSLQTLRRSWRISTLIVDFLSGARWGAIEREISSWRAATLWL